MRARVAAATSSPQARFDQRLGSEMAITTSSPGRKMVTRHPVPERPGAREGKRGRSAGSGRGAGQGWLGDLPFRGDRADQGVLVAVREERTAHALVPDLVRQVGLLD